MPGASAAGKTCSSNPGEVPAHRARTQGICEGVQGTVKPKDVLPFTESLHLVLTGKPEGAAHANDADEDDDAGASVGPHSLQDVRARARVAHPGCGHGSARAQSDDADGEQGSRQRHAQLTISDAIEFLDTLGFSRYVDQFERTCRCAGRTAKTAG